MSASGSRSLSAPTNVVASDGTFGHRVLINWSAAAGAITYAIFRPLQSRDKHQEGDEANHHRYKGEKRRQPTSERLGAVYLAFIVISAG